MNDILVSVIVPVWNVEKYLKRCMDSILNQTHKNIEVLLIDDGSPDSCPDICDEYARLDNRVKVFHQENEGLASARNAGLDNTNGEWICFVDSDDFIHDRFVELLLETAVNNDCISVRCKRKYTFKSVIEDAVSNIQSTTFNWFDFLIYCDNTPGYSIHSVCWGIYHCSIFKDLRFGNYTHSEDTPVSAQIMWYNRNKNFGVINQILYYYFQSPNSIIRSGTSLRCLERYAALEWLLEFWEEKEEYEVCDCYFKLYFTFLAKDYTELRRDLPQDRDKYEHLALKISENADVAKRSNLIVATIPTFSKRQYDELANFNGKLVIYGYGLRCCELYPWFNYFDIDIYEVWDEYADLYCETIVPVLIPRKIDNYEVRIIIAVDSVQEQILIKRKLRQMGYGDFVSCDNAFGAIKFAKYREFLPVMFE